MERDEAGKEFRSRIEENGSFDFLSALQQAKYKYIYDKYLPKEIKNKNHKCWFEGKDIKWIGDFSLDLLKSDDGAYFYQFENDLIITSSLHYRLIDNGYGDKIEISSLQLTVRVCAFDYPNSLSPSFFNLEIWTPEQKIINHFNKLIHLKYKELGFNSLSYRQGDDKFGLLTSIWPSIDLTDKKQVYASSYYYFQEIVDSYDQIMFLLTNAHLYSKYTSNYPENPIDRPESDLYYYMNLTLYDRRYLNFCSMAFERIYAFWERIAFLLFQYIKPVSLDKSENLVINDENLSLVKLIDQLKKEVKKNHHAFLLGSPSFDWFKNFVIGTHRKLCNYRHPLIHFRLDDTEIGKGNPYTYTQVFWLQNIGNKVKLENLQNENESLLPFLNEQFQQCEIGLDKVVQLILEIQKAKKQEKSLQ